MRMFAMYVFGLTFAAVVGLYAAQLVNGWLNDAESTFKNATISVVSSQN